VAHTIFQLFADDSAAQRLRINLTVARIGIVIVAAASCLGAMLSNKYSSVSTVLQ
jgi:Flp pilus assembly pilin Flp